ncbi:hypothetical protein ACFU7Y_43695, partial [Kitasatospora sp. NPDC057542]
MTVALAVPSATPEPGAGAPVGGGTAAAARPVVPAVWPHALASRPDGEPGAEPAAAGTALTAQRSRPRSHP